MTKKYKLTTLSCAIVAALSMSASTFAHTNATGITNYQIDNNKHKEWSNSYKKNDNLPEVTAYISNWSNWAQGYRPVLSELAKYDTVLYSFFGLCGTEIGEPSATLGVKELRRVCDLHGLQKYQLSSTDLYADLQRDFTLEGAPSDPNIGWLDPNPKGVWGEMKKLNEMHGTRIGISVFGWSLSNVASQAVRPENRQVFIDSLIEFVTVYPFVGQLDIDWEYPGIKGASGNVIDPVNDARNYKEFIAELRTALNTINRQDIRIGIASGAPHDKVDAAKLDDLVKAGVDNIHLMTYDFFGQWDTTLNHHTNLYSSTPAKWSADRAIQYMIHDLDIPAKNIQLGYSNYSRNGIVNGDLQPSPLRGNFSANPATAGTFEGATHAVHDLFANFLNVQPGQKLSGKNGYDIYTDKESNADFLYNETNKLFISVDTPRTAYAKSQYVIEHGLGGIFNWMGDHDEGLMLNAVREGLGYEVDKQVFDMESIINSCGVNVTATECTELTHNDTVLAPSISTTDQTAAFVIGDVYELTAAASGFDINDVKSIRWTTTSATGIDKALVVINNADGTDASFTINTTDLPMGDFNLVFALEVELNSGTRLNDTLNYELKVSETAPIISGILHDAEYSIADKGEFNFIASATDAGDTNLRYQWDILSDNAKSVDSLSNSVLAIDTSSLINRPSYEVKTQVTVTNKFGNTDTMNATTKVIGDANANAAPIASFEVVTPDSLVSGGIVTLMSTSQDELVDELRYSWVVKHNGANLYVDTMQGVSVTFVVEETGEYEASLTVTDVFDVTDTSTESVTIILDEAPIDPELPETELPVEPDSPELPETELPVEPDSPELPETELPVEPDSPLPETELPIEPDSPDTEAPESSWNSLTIYTGGEVVTHNGATYTAQWWTQGNEPGTNQVWDEADDGVLRDWSAAKTYDGGDTVLFNGDVYTAGWWTQGDKPDSSDVWSK